MANPNAEAVAPTGPSAEPGRPGEVPLRGVMAVPELVEGMTVAAGGEVPLDA